MTAAHGGRAADPKVELTVANSIWVQGDVLEPFRAACAGPFASQAPPRAHTKPRSAARSGAGRPPGNGGGGGARAHTHVCAHVGAQVRALSGAAAVNEWVKAETRGLVPAVLSRDPPVR